MCIVIFIPVPGRHHVRRTRHDSVLICLVAGKHSGLLAGICFLNCCGSNGLNRNCGLHDCVGRFLTKPSVAPLVGG